MFDDMPASLRERVATAFAHQDPNASRSVRISRALREAGVRPTSGELEDGRPLRGWPTPESWFRSVQQ